MFCELLRRSGIEIVLGLGVVLCCHTYSAAQDCACRKIGGTGFCVPDPACVSVNPASTDTDSAPSDSADLEIPIRVARANPKLVILDTGYSQLTGYGLEEPGYGLYSYAIFTSDSDRTSAFLGEVFKSVHGIDDSASPNQLNILYLPIKKKTRAAFIDSVGRLGPRPAELGAKYSRSFYDYKMARSILNHICDPPAVAIRETCHGALSRGPYIFTYARPASSLKPVPPPFLFVDLSHEDPREFAEYVSAFKEQVKQDDFSDGARINSFRLKILHVIVGVSTVVGPIQRKINDIIHFSGN